MRIHKRAWRGALIAGPVLAVTLGVLLLFDGGDAATANDTSASTSLPAGNSAEVAATQPASAPPASKLTDRQGSLLGSAYWLPGTYESLTGLLASAPIVVTGTVESAEIWGNREVPGVPRVEIESGPPPDLPETHPKYGKQGSQFPPDDDGPPNMTVYQFRISEVLADSRGEGLDAGQTISLYQNGGVKDGVAYTVEGFELFQDGERYLLFLTRSGAMEWYAAPPFGQFGLDGQTLIGPEYWVNAGAVKELAGRSVDEVRAMIQAASSQGASMPSRAIGTGYFNLHAAKSLANLLELTPDVVVGTVESAEIWGNRDIPGVPRPAIEEQTPASDWPPPGHPKHGRQGPVEWPDDGRPNITVYQFRISEVLANGSSDRLNAGDVIPLFQSGGVKDGIAYVIEGIELLQTGETYVLFIQRQGTMEWYSAAPYGQYRLDGQTLIGPEYWANAGVVKELAGRSVDEVRAMVKAAAAD